jgi:hypothetical protein
MTGRGVASSCSNPKPNPNPIHTYYLLLTSQPEAAALSDDLEEV